jgi:Holliday junction DNA helicase RuvB
MMMNRIAGYAAPAQPDAAEFKVEPPTSNPVRPQRLDGFIGQPQLKSLIRTAIVASRQRNAPFPHSLLTGAAGLGKTSLAQVIASEMGVGFVPTTAEALEDSAALKGLLSRLDGSGHDNRGNPTGTIRPTVLFIDEIHRLPRQSQELLYSCIEDRVIDIKVRDVLTGLMKPIREWVPHFTLIGATNRPGSLTTAFRDRLRLHLRFQTYGMVDSGKIARQALATMGLKCSPKCAASIAARGRGVPRRIISLCEQIRDIAVVKGKASVTPALCEKSFQEINVDPIGLSPQDVQYLQTLADSVGQPLGLGTLATVLGEEEQSVEESIEPFLLQRGLITRTSRGRALTPIGLEHLRQHHGFEPSGRTLS